MQRTCENSDQSSHWNIKQLYLLTAKFTKAYFERNLNEIVASLVESVPYMNALLPHITSASIRSAHIQVIHQVQVLVSKNPQGQRGFEALYEYLRKVALIIKPVITWLPFHIHFQTRIHIKDRIKERMHCVDLLGRLFLCESNWNKRKFFVTRKVQTDVF